MHLFTDSAKDVEVALMNAGIDFDADSGDFSERPAAQERLTFVISAREAGPPSKPAQIGVRSHVPSNAMQFGSRRATAQWRQPSLHCTRSLPAAGRVWRRCAS